MIHNKRLFFSQRMFSRHVENSSHALNYLRARSSAFRFAVNTFTAIVDLSRFNNSCLKSRQRRP